MILEIILAWVVIPLLCIGIFLMLLLLLGSALAKCFSDKCPHWKYCQWYQKDSYPCTKTGGYYHPDGPAGCCNTWNEKIRDRINGKEWESEKDNCKSKKK